MLEVLLTKVMILIYFSGPAAEAYATIFAKLPTKIKFVTLDEGPYNP